MADRLATSAVPVRSAFDASLQTILADPNQLLLAAAADGRSVGYLHGLVHPALHASGNNAWVDELWVDEDVRRRGVARAPMTAFDVWGADPGAVQVTLGTTRAGALYAALGYTESAVYWKKGLAPHP